MWRLIWHKLVLDWRRSVTTLAAVLVAVTSFVVLTGATTTQRLEVMDAAIAQMRSSYDILVRPPGARHLAEDEHEMVRPNFLSDTYGGITEAQWREIESIPGIEVAAPIATVGVVWAVAGIPVDLTEFVAESGDQVLRVTTEAFSRGGFHAPGRALYLYVTDEPFAPSEIRLVPQNPFVDTSTGPVLEREGVRAYPCLPHQAHGEDWGPGGDQVPREATEPMALYTSVCLSRQEAAGDYLVWLPLFLPLTVAAIDPAAEAALVGLDGSIQVGRYLTGWDELELGETPPGPVHGDALVPIAPALLAAASPLADYALVATIDELGSETVQELLEITDFRVHQMDLIAQAIPERTAEIREILLDDIYLNLETSNLTAAMLGTEEYRMENLQTILSAGNLGDGRHEITTCRVLRPGEVEFTEGSGLGETPLVALAAGPRGVIRQAGGCHMFGAQEGFIPAPVSIMDSAYRFTNQLTPPIAPGAGRISFDIVGIFDPNAIEYADGGVGQVPLETYRAPEIFVADDGTRAWLGQDEFLTNLNPSDYLLAQPTLLIPLQALGILDYPFIVQGFAEDNPAPISAVRVRVAGITGWDELSQARIQVAAEQIIARTGLEVDITIGSSLAPTPVTLTQIPHNGAARPNLHLTEFWSRLGVITTIADAVDLKSVLLFTLVLASGGLTIAAIASTAAAAQRRDLGTLAAVGFRPWRSALTLLGQQLALGLTGGALGAVISWPIARLLGVELNWAQALAAVPIAGLLATLAGLVAAVSAGRRTPIALLRPPARRRRRGYRVSRPWTLAVPLTLGRPLRFLASALAIGISVTSVTVLVAIAWLFQGQVAGTLLGEAIILQVRTADVVAGLILTLLGLVCLVTTMRFTHLEDAADWAVLYAIGWRGR
ncbi:MAG: hypothetical protein FWG25_03855, partial [Promicromonosporaceae bacterium]|nr:hypothetical protein [Promicromonosporaceae bacterium]